VQRPDEIFDVVNDRDEVIGQATRCEVHERGLKHRAAHVLLFNPKGELFVQKRSDTKDTFPGRYDSSASGHLDTCETYDACAARELHEELGIRVLRQELVRLFKINACQETGWEFVWVYTLRGDYAPHVNPSEIEAGEFWNLARVRAEMAEQPERFAPSFRRILFGVDTRGLVQGRD
jgi:isopentenyl-diphosphate delta-isomerase type 1